MEPLAFALAGIVLRRWHCGGHVLEPIWLRTEDTLLLGLCRPIPLLLDPPWASRGDSIDPPRVFSAWLLAGPRGPGTPSRMWGASPSGPRRSLPDFCPKVPSCIQNCSLMFRLHMLIRPVRGRPLLSAERRSFLLHRTLRRFACRRHLGGVTTRLWPGRLAD